MLKKIFNNLDVPDGEKRFICYKKQKRSQNRKNFKNQPSLLLKQKKVEQ